MRPEFNALGVSRRQRGRLTDETLDFLERCFANDEVEAHGQAFLFLPRPAKPPIYVGGAPPHALERAVRYGDGWLPMGGDAARLKAPIAELQDRVVAAGREPLEVKLLSALPLDEPTRAADAMQALAEVGVTSLIQGIRYDTAAEFTDAVGRLVELIDPAPDR
jgi:alkanesulfonate monooxygenase SsuD/methylene tetrahydromethanopterin reductase-like flavin-dependent oxidoreductase (luciferase family)